MVSLPFTDPVASPAVLTPRLKISQQQDSAGAGPGGLAEVASSLLGAAQGPDPWMSHLLGMRMTLALGAHVDNVVLHILDTAEAPAARLGDSVTISLGYGDDADIPLFTGAVQSLQTTLSGSRRMLLAGPALALARMRLNSSYQEQSAEDIILALLGEANVVAGTIDSGLQYPFYAVSDRHTLLAHIQALSEQQNWLCYVDADGLLNAHRAGSDDPARTFAYGVDLIELEHRTLTAPLAGIRVIGGGAATGNGADAWNWLSKTPGAGGEAGDGSRVVAQQALRDAPGAQGYADYLMARGTRAGNRVWLQTAAAPEVLPGRAFGISGAPAANADGVYLAERVVIGFDRQRGFISTIEGCSRDAATGDGAGLPGGLL